MEKLIVKMVLNMTESTFWHSTVRPALAPFGILMRVENRAQEGTPDVAYCLRCSSNARSASGWIELKHVYKWPARGLLKLRHLTEAQVAWLSRWEAAGGRCCVLIQVDRDYFLLDASAVKELARRGATKEQLIRRAAVYRHGVFPIGAVVKWLTTI